MSNNPTTPGPEPQVTVFRVGEVYPASEPPPYPERNQYNYTSGMHMLTLCFSGITDEELRSIESAPAEFAFLEAGDVIFLAYKFGDLPWQDAPYTFHLLRDDESRVLPEPVEGGHAWLHVTLVDAPTGVVKALRALTWSAEFTAAIEDAIRRQAEAPWCGAGAFDQQMEMVYAECYTSELLAARAEHRTKGGA